MNETKHWKKKIPIYAYGHAPPHPMLGRRRSRVNNR
jgi:hypothetical protein